MTKEELEVFKTHAIAVHHAAELLAKVSQRAVKEDWLVLILSRARDQYAALSPGEVEEILKQVREAAKFELSNPQELVSFIDRDGARHEV